MRPPSRRRAGLRPWHWLAVTLAAILALLLLWFLLAYGGLPRLWSHHEHKRIGRRDAVTAYTAQDIPADPVNLRVLGSGPAIACAYRRAGWALADPVSLRSAVRIGVSVVARRAYPQAPVSSLYVDDRVQDLAFERDEGGSADRRHHVRFWQVAPGDWLGAASYDRGVGLSLFTGQVTHHIGPDVDAERALSGRVLTGAGAQVIGSQSSRIAPGVWHRNGGGDRYRTDGRIAVYRLGDACGVDHAAASTIKAR